MMLWNKRAPLLYLQVDHDVSAEQVAEIRRVWDETIRLGKTPIVSKDIAIVTLVPFAAYWAAWLSCVVSVGTLMWVISR